MPYLIQEDRESLDQEGYDNLLQYLVTLDIKDFLGVINYMVFKAVRRWIKTNGQKYWIFAGLVGTLLCCILEIYRRLVAPYEDKKIEQNGDVKWIE